MVRVSRPYCRLCAGELPHAGQPDPAYILPMEDVSIILRAEEAAERTTRDVAELASDAFEGKSS